MCWCRLLSPPLYIDVVVSWLRDTCQRNMYLDTTLSDLTENGSSDERYSYIFYYITRDILTKHQQYKEETQKKITITEENSCI